MSKPNFHDEYTYLQRQVISRHGFITEILFGGMPKKIDGMSVGWYEIS